MIFILKAERAYDAQTERRMASKIRVITRIEQL